MMGSVPRKWGKQNVLARRGSMQGLGVFQKNPESFKFDVWLDSIDKNEDSIVVKVAKFPQYKEYLESLVSELKKQLQDEQMTADDAISIFVDQCNDVLLAEEKQAYKIARQDNVVSTNELKEFLENKKAIEITKEILFAELMAFAYFAIPNFNKEDTQEQLQQQINNFSQYFKALAKNLTLAVLANEITLDVAKEEAKSQFLDVLEIDTTKQKYATQRQDNTLSDEEWTAIKATLAKKAKADSGVTEESSAQKTSTTKIAVMASVGVVALLGMVMFIKKS